MIRRRSLILCVGIAAALSSTIAAAGPPRAESHVGKKTRVAVYVDKGASGSMQFVFSALRASPRLEVERVLAEDVRAGKLSDFDVILHPGGGARVQGRTLGEDGRERVREFVRQGGGYVGICAGAYLATGEVDAYLGILDADVVDFEHWARGTGEVEISLTAAGRTLLGAETDRVKIQYGQGPLLAPAGRDDLPDYQLLARYESEIAKKGAPQGVMVGTSAIVTGVYGQGRIICFSPHPEKTESLRTFISRGALWAAGVERPDADHQP